MRKLTIIFGVLAFSLLCTPRARTQDTPSSQDASTPDHPIHYYRLDFVVQEVSPAGKPTNSRSYTGIASTGRGQGLVSLRAGSRIPVVTGTSSGTKNVQYLDVGVNIDARDTHEVSTMLALQLSAEISGLASPTGLTDPSTPVIRQTRWQAPVLIPLRKPTTVFTSDNLDNKDSLQLVLTATPIQ